MTIRTDFEAWASSYCIPLEKTFDEYEDSHTADLWKLFQYAHALYAPRWVPVGEQPIPTAGLVDVRGATGERYTDCYYDRICDEWRTITPTGHLFCVKRSWITHWMQPPSTEGLE